MTAQEIKDYIREKLVVRRRIAQEIDVFDTIIDFISQSITSGIPAWDDELTFNEDGSGDGAFTTFPGETGTLRFWKSKIAANINNAPPTNSEIIEDDNWIEVSPATGSALKEWAAGLFGTGLIVVTYDFTGTSPRLYKLNEAIRPFNSINFLTELAAGKWVEYGAKIKGAAIYIEELYDASSGEYPAAETAPGTGLDGAIERSNIYEVGTASEPEGDDGDIKFPVGAKLRARIDNPENDDAHWEIMTA